MADDPKRGNGGTPPKPDFPYIWVSDAAIDFNSRYLLKGLIEQGSFSLIYGPSGSGKSFFTADIAQHIATGASWRGRKVNQSLVVYVASEAGASIIKRFFAWRENRMGEAIEAIPLAVLTRGPNLLLKVQVEMLRVQLMQMQDEAKLPLGQIVFDTLSRSMPGGDENNAKDMTEVISTADYLRDEFRAATTFVHHSGKNVEMGARGHSSLFAAADCVMCVSDRVARLEKVRDGVAGEQFPFSLEPVTLGEDADGDPITTCLLSHADQGSMPKIKRVPAGRNQKVVLEPLKALIHKSGQRSPGTSVIPAGVMMVTINELCERMQPEYPDLKPHRVRQKVSEALIGLKAAGHVGQYGEFVWIL